jgi:PAS domain S-box-containing protein
MGSHYLDKTTQNSVAMLQNNYRTMKYTREMTLTLNRLITIMALDNTTPSLKRTHSKREFANFERYLKLQLANVTEQEEGEVSKQLQEAYVGYKSQFELMLDASEFSPVLYIQTEYIQDLLEDVYGMNENTIQQKTENANQLANRITLITIVLSFFFFIIALASMFYFPDYIADPVIQLTESIKQIARKNYNQRLDISTDDEFGEMARSFNKMAEKLEEYENINVHQVVSEKRRIETIISQINEAIIGMDNNQIILFVNPRALELMGLDEVNVVGKRASELGKKSDFLADMVKEVVAKQVTDSKRHYASVTVDRDGKRYYYDKDILKVESQDSDDNSRGRTSVGYVIILKNITELKEQDLAKTNFMATLSHELKTPISAIDMSLNLLEDDRLGGLNEDQKDLSGTIRQNASRLLKMVNEILDISKIETGNVQIAAEEAPPEVVVLRALQNVKTFINEKDLQVVQNIPENLPNLKMDIPKTTGVLVNFLTNAIRYSDPMSSIEIEVFPNNGTVQFSVKDFGRGISKEDLKKVFNRYHRAKDDNTKGTGLGLAISKEFIEAQGGKIWVKSEVGKGSVFSFALPV